MEITLRDRSYTAEHLTDLNYLPLGSLFVDDKGSFTIEGVGDYNSLPQNQKLKIVQPLMTKLSDPDQKASIAHSLCSIFPTLPRELVRYNGKSDFAMNLTLSELLQVAIDVANALPQPGKAMPSVKELDNRSFYVKEARMVRLGMELEQAEDIEEKVLIEAEYDRLRSELKESGWFSQEVQKQDSGRAKLTSVKGFGR